MISPVQFGGAVVTVTGEPGTGYTPISVTFYQPDVQLQHRQTRVFKALDRDDLDFIHQSNPRAALASGNVSGLGRFCESLVALTPDSLQAILKTKGFQTSTTINSVETAVSTTWKELKRDLAAITDIPESVKPGVEGTRNGEIATFAFSAVG